MKTLRKPAAGVLLVLAVVLATLAACGQKPSKPGAQPSRSPVTTAPAAPTTAPSGSITTPTAPPPSLTAPGATEVVSARVAYQWHWPNDVNRPGTVTHRYTVPPVPQLVRIGVGDHPRDPGQRPFNRMSFTFNTAFPSYRIEFTDKLVGDGRGEVIPLHGLGVLKVVFTEAQAHSADGTRSTIVSQPAPYIGYRRMVEYAQGGDFEGVLTYGIGITWPNPQSNPQISVRAYEVETVTSGGLHRYVVAIDVDAT
jgi:hypothetical protein